MKDLLRPQIWPSYRASFRGIPLYWRLIDCSFGIVGIVPLWLGRRYILELQALSRP